MTRYVGRTSQLEPLRAGTRKVRNVTKVSEDHVSEDKAPIVVVEGEVDLAVAPSLRERLKGVVAEGHPTLYVDLLGATFLDSTALGVLVTTRELCHHNGGELNLIVDNPRILKVLEITGLSDVFPIYNSRDAIPATGRGDEVAGDE
jgi:anti-sigma B factor antagonist